MMYFPRFTGETITVKGSGRIIRQCAITPAGSNLETRPENATQQWVTDKLQVLTLDYAAATSVIAGDVLIIRGLEFTVTGTPFSHYSVFGTGAGGVQIEAAIAGQPGAVIPENPGPGPGPEPEPEPVTDWTDPDTYAPVNTAVLEYSTSTGWATRTPDPRLMGTYGRGAVDIATGRFSSDYFTAPEVPKTHRALYTITGTAAQLYTAPQFLDDEEFITGWGDFSSTFRVTWEPGYLAHATPTGGLVTNLGADVVPINSVWDLTTGRRIRDYRTHEYMEYKGK